MNIEESKSMKDGYIMALCQVKDAVLNKEIEDLMDLLDIVNIGLYNANRGYLTITHED